jgi:hypothetical protein
MLVDSNKAALSVNGRVATRAPAQDCIDEKIP